MLLDEKVTPFSTDRRHHIDAEAVRAADRGEPFRRAGAPLAVGEVVADHDMAGAEAPRHDVGGERLGAEGRKRLVEGNDEGLVETELREELQLERQGVR